MSLLTVAQAVAEEVGLPSPSAVVGNSSKQVKQLLRLINRAGKTLAKKNWTVLQKEHTFETVDGTAAYSLPSDFDRFLAQTAWDRDQYWSLRGPLTPREWQVKKSALVATATLRSSFRVKPDTRVNKYYLDPTPSGAYDHVFEYASSQWVKDTGNTTGKTAYAADSDVAIISEELVELEAIWRLLERKGYAYAEAKDEAETQIARAFAEDAGVQVLDMGAGSVAPYNARLNVQEGDFG